MTDPTIAILVEQIERLHADNAHLRATLDRMEARRSPWEHLPCVTAIPPEPELTEEQKRERLAYWERTIAAMHGLPDREPATW